MNFVSSSFPIIEIGRWEEDQKCGWLAIFSSILSLSPLSLNESFRTFFYFLDCFLVFWGLKEGGQTERSHFSFIAIYCTVQCTVAVWYPPKATFALHIFSLFFQMWQFVSEMYAMLNWKEKRVCPTFF